MPSMPSNDASLARRRYEFVVEQLNHYSGIKKKINEHSIFIPCPFHNEKTPSGRIFFDPTSRSPGYFVCYGCGHKARWDELAPKIGLKPFAHQKPSVQYAHRVLTHTEEERKKKDDLKFSPLPKNKLWRSIPTNVLISLGAKLCQQSWSDEKFVFLPVLIRKELKGYIKARLRKKAGETSYINASGGWSAKYGLFPYDYSVELMQYCGSSVLVLVEGPRDALRLINKGLPAIAVLGTQSWSPVKSRMLELSGASHIILMMDGDCAGKKAEELILPTLKGMVEVSTFSLRGEDSPYHQFADEDEPTKAAKAAGVELWDPGNCPEWKLNQLLKMMRKIKTS
jgi:Toprim domain/CHC2 zinc finger